MRSHASLASFCLSRLALHSSHGISAFRRNIGENNDTFFSIWVTASGRPIGTLAVMRPSDWCDLSVVVGWKLLLDLHCCQFPNHIYEQISHSQQHASGGE